MLDFDQWQADLTKLIATALGEFTGGKDDEMERFAVDCHPWNGIIVLAFLTKSELKDAPCLSDAAENGYMEILRFRSRHGMLAIRPPSWITNENRIRGSREQPFQGG